MGDLIVKKDELSNVLSKLTPVESEMLQNENFRSVGEIADNELIPTLSTLIASISIDVGITNKDNKEMSYMGARIVEVIKKYYSFISLQDVKTAFELLCVGELDNYLPRIKGAPDKNHYQKFNIDYFSKVMKAYLKKKNEAIGKAYTLLPEEKATQSEINAKNSEIDAQCEDLIQEFKETKELTNNPFKIMFLYSYLKKRGLISIKVTDDDKRAAYMHFMKQVSKGIVNKYTAEHVRRGGKESKELEYPAIEFAKKRQVKEALTKLIKENKL